MDTYKKGEYIAVMTNQPNMHFLEMFGHGLSTDNVKPSKYVGKIMNVIDDENYQILIVHPIPVYRCVIHVSEILRKVSETELDEDFIKATLTVWKHLIRDPLIYDLVKMDSEERYED